jgi:Mrp family chromosome partitioning ATPase
MLWKLRNALASLGAATTPKVVQVTGLHANNGATTTAVALALAGSQSGKIVLVIDANESAPAVRRLLGLPTQPAGRTQSGPSPADPVVEPTGRAGLSVLSLAGDELPQTLSSVRDRFDLIVIDSPPVMSFSTVETIGRFADARLITIDRARTTRAQADRATELLGTGDARAVGIVLRAE